MNRRTHERSRGSIGGTRPRPSRAAVEVAPAAMRSPPTARARSGRSSRRPPRTSRQRKTSTSPSASPEPAADSSGSAPARPTSPMPLDRSTRTRQVLCEDGGVEYIEFRVATDALTNVVNTDNDWVTCLTVEQLNAIWKPGSKVVELEPGGPVVPGRPAQALRRGNGLGHVRLLHRRDQRRGRARVAPTSRRPKTTTSPSRESPAIVAPSATSASRTTRRTRTP